MLKRIYALCTLCLLLQTVVCAQKEEELVGFDFTYVGEGKVSDQLKISIQRYDLRAMIPMKLRKKDAYLLHGINLGRSNVKYGTHIANEAKVNRFHTISYNLTLAKPIRNGWYMYAGGGPHVASNFDSGLQWRELQFNGMLMFSKMLGKEEKLEFSCGVFYHPSFGVESPLPMIGMTWRPNQNWDINFGFPEFSVNYKLGKNSSLGANLFITGDEYTLSKGERLFNTLAGEIGEENNLTPEQMQNLSEEELDQKYKKINRFSYSDYGVGLMFKHKMFNCLQLRLNSGYTFYRKMEFKKNQKKIVEEKSTDKLFIQAGISFMI